MTASRGRALHTASLILFAAVAACSKPQDPPTAPKPRAGAIVAPAPSTAQAPVDEALKDRLARQEAAARMFDPKNEVGVLQPAPPKTAIVASPPEPPKAAPTPAPAPIEPPKPAPAETKAAAAPPPATPAPAPVAPPKVAVAAPPTDVKPAPAKAAPREPRLVARVEPDFPPEAVRAGITSGTVKARMTLDGAGQVTRVDIVEATPRRVFDKAVMRALSQWRFTEGEDGRSVESEVAFRR